MALSPRFRATAVVVAVAATGGLMPSTAAAGQFYEQVSRTSGPYETALTNPNAVPAAVGDVGRFAAFRTTFSNGQDGAFVRDVRSNLTTQPGGPATKYIWGFDRAETKALIAREINGQVELRIAPLVGGGTSKLLYTSPRAPFYDAASAANGGYSYYVKAALSGDGSTVVAADSFAGKAVKISVATGQITQLQTIGQTGNRTNDNAWELGEQAISDDGRTVVINRPYIDSQNTKAGRIYRDGLPVLEVSEPAIVSPDGSTIVYSTPFNGPVESSGMIARKLATGTAKLLSAASYLQGWINSSGSKLWVSESGQVNEYDTATGARSVAPASAQFGGLRSPSGRFAMPGPILVDTTRADLPGAADPIAAEYYLKPGATFTCRTFTKGYGTVNATLFSNPIPWAAKSVKAEVKLYVDVSLLKTTTIAASTSTSAPFVGTPKLYRVVGTVTDDQGRVVTGEVRGGFQRCPY